jgi:hypothetical protein
MLGRFSYYHTYSDSNDTLELTETLDRPYHTKLEVSCQE